MKYGDKCACFWGGYNFSSLPQFQPREHELSFFFALEVQLIESYDPCHQSLSKPGNVMVSKERSQRFPGSSSHKEVTFNVNNKGFSIELDNLPGTLGLSLLRRQGMTSVLQDVR